MSTDQRPASSLDEVTLTELFQAYLRWMQEELDETLAALANDPGSQNLARRRFHPVSETEFAVRLHHLPEEQRAEYIRSLQLGRAAAVAATTERLEQGLETAWDDWEKEQG